jgi:hypothetical protein
VAQFIYYNTEFVQFQGRYLYTGLVPFTLLVGGGLDRLMAWLMERGGARDSDSRGNGGRGTPRPYGSVGDVGTSNGASISDYIAVGVIALLIPLNLWLLWRVIPGLAP